MNILNPIIPNQYNCFEIEMWFRIAFSLQGAENNERLQELQKKLGVTSITQNIAAFHLYGHFEPNHPRPSYHQSPLPQISAIALKCGILLFYSLQGAENNERLQELQKELEQTESQLKQEMTSKNKMMTDAESEVIIASHKRKMQELQDEMKNEEVNRET